MVLHGCGLRFLLKEDIRATVVQCCERLHLRCVGDNCPRSNIVFLSMVPKHTRSRPRYVTVTGTGPNVPLRKKMTAENISLPLRNVLNSIQSVRDGVLGKLNGLVFFPKEAHNPL